MSTYVSGEVYLTRALDYESLLTHTKRLIVEATTQSGQSATATLEVNILNINDNYPQFQRSVSCCVGSQYLVNVGHGGSANNCHRRSQTCSVDSLS
mgnify:FL=1